MTGEADTRPPRQPMLCFPPEVQAAVDAVKREMGMTTAPACDIAEHLPPELRGPFWAAAIDQYLNERRRPRARGYRAP